MVFDVGETLIDETRHWTVLSEAVGVPPLTFFAVFGSLIERGEDHRALVRVGRGEAEVGSSRSTR